MPLDARPPPADEPPCPWGLLAGTLALMTAHASPEPEGLIDAPTLRRLMARKIVSNLFFLQHHPAAPPPLRAVATQLHGRWLLLLGRPAEDDDADDAAPPAAPDTAWH